MHFIFPSKLYLPNQIIQVLCFQIMKVSSPVEVNEVLLSTCVTGCHRTKPFQVFDTQTDSSFIYIKNIYISVALALN